MSDITKKNIVELKEKLAKKEISAVELSTEYLKNIKEKNSKYNAYISVYEEKALEMAKISDQKIASGNAGVLEGIPLAIKDNFCTKNVKTTCASKILYNFVPQYESTVTKNLWQDGAVLLGKANMDEFAMGSSNLTSHYGPVLNPFKKNNDDTELVAGGSSGGSAVAVSGNLASGSLGSDTGGSVRQPASFNGLVGTKPTYGRCSRLGMIAFASSLDQAGPITRNVADNALLLNSISGYDNNDSTSVNKKKEDFTASLNQNIKGLKIGVPKDYQLEGMDPAINDNWQNAVKALKNLGAEIIDISLEKTKYSAAVYYIIATAEASSNLARFDGVRYGFREDADSLDNMYEKTRDKGFGFEVKKRIMAGTYVLSSGYYDAYYKKASQVRRILTNELNSSFQKVDAIITPTTPNAPFGKNDKLRAVELYYADLFTVSANLSGIPAISLPAGVNKDNLPLSVQIMAPHFQEKLMFQIANNLEKELAFDINKLNFR